MLKQSELGVGTDGGAVLVSRVGRLSRSTVRSAMDVLRRRHGIDPDTAFDVLRTVSQQHNVKLRAVAAAMVKPDVADEEPPLVKPSAIPSRTEVLRDLMRAAIA